MFILVYRVNAFKFLVLMNFSFPVMLASTREYAQCIFHCFPGIDLLKQWTCGKFHLKASIVILAEVWTAGNQLLTSTDDGSKRGLNLQSGWWITNYFLLTRIVIFHNLANAADMCSLQILIS